MPDYAFDAELAATIPLIPSDGPITDFVATRARAAELYRQQPAPVLSGLDIAEIVVPGAPGGPDVPVRVYTPHVVTSIAAVLDIHGGGFVGGSAEMSAGRNAELCRRLGVRVFSVDYRLAPEHPYPAALEDCYAVLCWLAWQATELGIGPGRIALRGISADGCLAAAVALYTRDHGGPVVCFQYLSIPVLDDRLATPSMTAFTDTPIWHRPNAEISWRAYLGEIGVSTEAVSCYAAPARATDLRGLSPTYVSVMQYDPLRAEGIAYALALQDAGVNVELHLFPGTFHGSSMLPSVVSKRENEEEIAVLGRSLVGKRSADLVVDLAEVSEPGDRLLYAN